MKLQKFILSIGSIMAALSLLSCAAGPSISNYPQREIDRPATVPDGLSKWYIQTEVSKYKDNFSHEVTTYDINPVGFETSLSDDWSLIWSPLPFGVSHQFWNTQQSRLSFLVFLGFGYGSISGLKLSPNLRMSYRLKLTKDLGFDLTPYFDPDIYFKEGYKYRWSAGFSAGPLFQVSDSVAVKPTILYKVYHGRPFIDADYSDDDQTHYRTGLGLEASVYLSQQWTFEPSYKYIGLTSPNGYAEHDLHLNFIHIW